MSYQEVYKQKLTTADEAVKAVKSGDWVDYGWSVCSADALDKALARRMGELTDVKIRGGILTHKPAIFDVPNAAEHFCWNSWHMGGIERKAVSEGFSYYIPLRYSELPGYYRNCIKSLDVAMFQVAPMDEHGWFNFGPGGSHLKAVCECAKTVIVEVNKNMPVCLGGFENCIHIDDVDMIVEGPHDPLPSIQTPPASEAETRIAEFVVENMDDGATLQLGIGSLPNAVGQMLAQSDLRDLGIHTEMLCDCYLDMYRAGKITNKRKDIDRYKSVFGFAIGSEDLYDWVRENPGVVTYPISYCNAPSTVRNIENFVSINNCISVDLYGQICAESAGTRQISGTGGQLDFLEGAAVSPGGKAFICLTSTFTDKQGEMVSRITPLLNPGDIVTDPRSLAYYIVTEYGGVNLVGCSTWERAERLISVAHPKFRDELVEHARQQGIWIRSNKR